MLMARVPEGLDVAHLRGALEGVEGVIRLHDLHVWTLTSGILLLTAHVEVEEETNWNRVINACVRSRGTNSESITALSSPNRGPCTNRESDI